MVISKIIKFENMQPNSHYYFEKAVNDVLGDIQRVGGYIMNVRFEKQTEEFNFTPAGAPGLPKIYKDYFYAYILFNHHGRKMDGPVEDRSKPVLDLPQEVFESKSPDVIEYKGIDVTKMPVDIQAICERLMIGNAVSAAEHKELAAWVEDYKLSHLV